MVHRYDDRCCGSLEFASPIVSGSPIRGALVTGDSLPETVQIHRAKCTVVKPISGLPGLPPNHPAVIGANRPVKPGLVQCGENRAHVDVTMVGRVSRFLERPHAGALDVATVGEVDASSTTNAPDDVSQVVCDVGRQRAGAKSDAICRIVDDIDDPLQRS